MVSPVSKCRGTQVIQRPRVSFRMHSNDDLFHLFSSSIIITKINENEGTPWIYLKKVVDAVQENGSKIGM